MLFGYPLCSRGAARTSRWADGACSVPEVIGTAGLVTPMRRGFPGPDYSYKASEGGDPNTQGSGTPGRFRADRFEEETGECLTEGRARAVLVINQIEIASEFDAFEGDSPNCSPVQVVLDGPE